MLILTFAGRAVANVDDADADEAMRRVYWRFYPASATAAEPVSSGCES
jgi:hypothetical protein